MTNNFEKFITLNSVDIEKISFSIINNSKFFLKSIKNSKLYYLSVPNSISWKLNDSKLYFSSFFYKEVLQFLRLFQIWLKKQESIIKKKLILKGLGFRISFDEKLNMLILKVGYSHLVNISLPMELLDGEKFKKGDRICIKLEGEITAIEDNEYSSNFRMKAEEGECLENNNDGEDEPGTILGGKSEE